ncbi:hypothetical protein BGZ65_012430, partial [Modicella reniformis]
MSNEGARKKTKDDEDDKLLCYLCMKEFSTTGSLRTHKNESHDGSSKRILPLKCLCCDKFAQTRKGLKNHMRSCSEVANMTFPLSCSWCKKMETILEDIRALADHCLHCDLWPQVSAVGQEEDMRKFDKELVENTRHLASAQCAKKMFLPVEMKVAGGQKLFGFVFDTSSKLLGEGKVALVSPLKRRLEETVEDVDLELALKPHKYGRL